MNAEMKSLPKRYLRPAGVAIAAALVLTVLTACYAPLGVEATGGLAINMTLPGSISAQSGGSYIARVIVFNQEYEDQLRRAIAIGMFVDENKDQVVLTSEVRAYLDSLEDEAEELLANLLLRAPVRFGGKYYIDIPINTGSGAGEFVLPGIPAGRSYIVYARLFESGVPFDEDDDPAYESLVWEDVADRDIDDWLFFDGDRPGIMSAVTLSAARDAFDIVLNGQGDNRGYMNVRFREGVSVPVVAGRTEDATIEFKDVSGD